MKRYLALLVAVVLLASLVSVSAYTRATGGKLWINGKQFKGVGSGMPFAKFSTWDLGQGYIQMHGMNSDWKRTTLSISWDAGKKNPRGWYWVEGSKPVYFKLNSFTYSVSEFVSFSGSDPNFSFRGENLGIDPDMSWAPLPHF